MFDISIIFTSYARAIRTAINNLIPFLLSISILGLLSTVLYVLNGCTSNLFDTTAFENRSILGHGIMALVLLVTTFVGIAILRIAMKNGHHTRVSGDTIVTMPSFSVFVRSFLGFYSLYWVIMHITPQAKLANLFYLFLFAIMATAVYLWIDEKVDHLTTAQKLDTIAPSSLFGAMLMALSAIVCIKLWSMLTAIVVTSSADALLLESACMQQLPALYLGALFFSTGLIIIAWAFGAFYKQAYQNSHKRGL